MTTELPQTRIPRNPTWREASMALGYRAASFTGRAFVRGRLTVTTSLDNAELPDGSGVGPQWHIAISGGGVRPTDEQIRRALHDFEMVGAEEDNHHPGIARHFFLVVDPAKRVDCQCKATEDVRVEPDGYSWTNPKPETGEECRGCEWQRLFNKPCPVHTPAF